MLLGRAGSEVQSFMEALGRIISLYLRSNGSLTAKRRLQLAADQLKGIGGANQMGFGTNKVLSVVDGIGKLFDAHLGEGPEEAESAQPLMRQSKTESVAREICPSCGAPSVVFEEGCMHCSTQAGGCGIYSKC